MSNLVPLRRVTSMTYGEALASDARIDGPVPVMSSGGVTGNHHLANTVGPCIVVGRKGSHGSVWWSDGPAFVIDTAYSIDRSNTSNDLRWLYYVLTAAGLRGVSNDVGVPGLSREAAYELPVPVPPPLPEQRRIGNFLDDQVARIDNIIGARRSQIELVRESVSHVLVDVAREQGATLGSPLPWFPAWHQDWTVQRLAWVVRCLDGQRVPLNSVERGERQGEFPYYGASTIVDYVDDYLFDGEFVLIGEDGAALENPRFDVVQRVSGQIWVNNHTHVLEATGVDVDYLAHFMRCVDRPLLISGATRPKITQEDLLSIPIVIPPVDSQAKLVAACAERIDQNESSIALLRVYVQRMEELKRSLIAAAVIGEFDVSSADGSRVSV